MAAVGAQQEAARQEVCQSVALALAAAREQVCARSAPRDARCALPVSSPQGPPSPFGQKKRKADAGDSSGSKATKPITSKWFAEMEEVGEDNEDDEDDDST